MVVTTLDKTGLDFIKRHEGLRLTAYRCPAGIPTIAWGQTYYPWGTKVKMGDKITLQQAEDMFKAVLLRYETLALNVTRDDLRQNQFNALVSFAYNVGTQALKNSTLLRKVNNDPDDTTIRNEFGKWVFANCKILTGLVRRRDEEATLYFTK